MFVFECKTQNRHCLVLFLGQYNQLSRPSLSSEIQEAYEENLRPELVIFLFPKYLNAEINALLKDEEFLIDLKRAKKSLIIGVGFDSYCDYEITNIIQGDKPKILMEELAADIIKSGCTEMVRGRENEVLVKSPAGTIFSKPSGNDKEEFIYASHLARHSSEYQFLAMALLKHAPPIEKITCIHIDTASIAAIAEALTYYISKFVGSSCKHVSYLSYSSYAGMEESKPDNDSGAWVVISASASLAMGKEIVKIWNIKPEQVVTILSYKPLLVDESKNIGNSVLFCVDEFSKRDDKSFSPIKVQVQGENFSVEVDVPDRVIFKQPHKPGYINQAVYPYRGGGVFHSNRNEHPIYIDYCSFRNAEKGVSEKYKAWLDQVMQWSIPRDLLAIIYCDSEYSSELAEDFKDSLRRNGFNLEDIKEYNAKELDQMTDMGDAAVLVISPTISSGHCFIDVNRALRLAGHIGMRVFVTPYTTATSSDKFVKFKNSLTKGINGFDYSFFSYCKIYIGEKENSSWYKEKGYLVKLINAVAVAEDNEDEEGLDFWKGRLSILQKEGDGLVGKIGVSYAGVEEKLTLSPGWVFWPNIDEKKKTEMDCESVYATVCGVLQNSREKNISGRRLSSNIYKHSVIDPENFVRFNDPLLQSCIWRAATPSELDYRRSDILSTDFQRILSKMMEARLVQKGEICLDLLIAISIRWIKISDRALKIIIVDAEKYLSEPYAKLLIQYIKKDFKAFDK